MILYVTVGFVDVQKSKLERIVSQCHIGSNTKVVISEFGNFRRKISGKLFRSFREFVNYLPGMPIGYLQVCKWQVQHCKVALQISKFVTNNSPDLHMLQLYALC